MEVTPPPALGAEDLQCTLLFMKDPPSADWDTSVWDRNISPYGLERSARILTLLIALYVYQLQSL